MAISPGVKLQGREADHLAPSSAEVKNVGAIPPLPHIFMAQGYFYLYNFFGFKVLTVLRGL
jgi:hypothetical protein